MVLQPSTVPRSISFGQLCNGLFQIDMKQVIQDIRRGGLSVETTPVPQAEPGRVLIANRYSIISVGTEKMARSLAQKSLLGKARERPDHVRRVLEKVRNEGLLSTFRQVREKLDEPMSMGYCSAGVVIACGSGVSKFKPGDLVASNGSHAEVVSVPEHLCASVPEQANLEHAAFAVLGAVALQGVRLSKLALGETAFIIGLGLVGQITVALLKAAGVRVIGTDLDPARCELATRMGADIAQAGLRASDVASLTGELGADAVMVTASTSSDGPVKLAGEAVRQKGRVVAVGAIGMNLERRAFYFKEAEFVVSCSYGPGRYDPRYEEGGQDYPAAYVRWTEQRNMQAILDLMATGKLDLAPLITHRFPIEEATKAYELIETGREPTIGVVLRYSETTSAANYATSIDLPTRRKTESESGAVRIGCLGAGNFARMVLLPKLCAMDTVRPAAICSAGGQSALHVAKKLDFATATSDETEVIHREDVDAVFVVTRHNDHARQVTESIQARKHVFVEKPLCLAIEELESIESELLSAGSDAPLVMVGFNRRFSPAALAVRKFFDGCHAPQTVSIRFNAGAIPTDHWTQDPHIGGGRIIGEACHAIDLATYLTGSPVTRVFAESIGGPFSPAVTDDQCYITLRHANGSVSNVAYLAGGDKALPKERIEMFGDGKVAVIEDFRLATGWRGGKRKRLWKGSQDKGHQAELHEFVRAIREGQASPIPWADLRATSLAAILAVQSLREGVPLEIPVLGPTASESRADDSSSEAIQHPLKKAS